MDEQAASLMKSVRFTIDERQHIEHDSNENEENHRGECALGLDGFSARGAEVQATTDEVKRSLRIFSQRFRPTDFYEADRTPDCRMAGLNFQKLPFGRSDAEQESHSGLTIVNRRTMPLFEDPAIVIHRAHQAIGAGTNPRVSCFPPTFGPKRLSTPPYGFMTRLLLNLHAHFPQQCLAV
jgi:hypothetical protein